MLPLILGFLVAFPLAVWRGLILIPLWEWFIVPFGVLPITLWWAAGLSLVVAFLTHQLHEEKGKDGWDRLLDMVARGIIFPPLMLGFGWVYHMFSGM